MKGMLAKVLILIAVSATGLVGQEIPPVFDSTRILIYASSLGFPYPQSRDFNGGGARAKGMGNAFIGISDDISAVSWNPAGLYRQDDPYEQPVLALSYQSLSADAGMKTYLWGEWRQYDYHDVFGGVDFMSILFPLRVKGHMFVGSLAYTRIGDEVLNAGMSVDTMVMTVYEDVENDSIPFHYKNLTNFRSTVNTINIGFGTRLYNNLTFGLAINFYGGQAAGRMDETVIWENMVHPTLPMYQRGTGLFHNSITDTTSFSGVYFTIGFKYTTEKLSAGLIIKTPHTLKQTTDMKLSVIRLFNGIEQAGSGNVFHFDDNVTELDQPLVLGIGLGYNVLENLLMSADFEYRSYGGGMVNVRDSLELVPGGTNVEYFTEYNPYWNSTMAFRFGSEYVWHTGSRLFPTVPLRVGFGFIQVPEPDVKVNTLGFPGFSTATMTRWSIGTGLRWEQIHLDVSYARTSLDQDDVIWLQRSTSDNGILNLTFTGYF